MIERYLDKEIHFDIVCCIYKDMCEKYHCLEKLMKNDEYIIDR